MNNHPSKGRFAAVLLSIGLLAIALAPVAIAKPEFVPDISIHGEGPIGDPNAPTPDPVVSRNCVVMACVAIDFVRVTESGGAYAQGHHYSVNAPLDIGGTGVMHMYMVGLGYRFADGCEFLVSEGLGCFTGTEYDGVQAECVHVFAETNVLGSTANDFASQGCI